MIPPINFSETFRDADPRWASNLISKIGNPPSIKTHPVFCLWSDLLGFSNIFKESNWSPDDNQKRKIYDRLVAAHSSALYFSDPFERDLILNDGIAKVFIPKSKQEDRDNILSISLFLRSCVQMHLAINQYEKEKGLPGCRSILAFGENIEYLAEEIRFDDYFYNYSKQSGEDISVAAKRAGNPIVIYNPKELQMNTAFSKAFILESGGTKAGLRGNEFYIDQSVIDAISRYSIDKGYKPIWRVKEDCIEYFIPREEGHTDLVVIGFEFDKEQISTQGLNYNSRVYKVNRFYPFDEKTSEFYFDMHC